MRKTLKENCYYYDKPKCCAFGEMCRECAKKRGKKNA